MAIGLVNIKNHARANVALLGLFWVNLGVWWGPQIPQMFDLRSFQIDEIELWGGMGKGMN